MGSVACSAGWLGNAETLGSSLWANEGRHDKPNADLTCDVAQNLVFATGRELRGRKARDGAYTDDM